MTAIQMWEKVPALDGEAPVLEYYPAENKKSDATVVIFPGGGYAHRAKHEGEGYALYLNSIGIPESSIVDLEYFDYARSKYLALGMPDTMPPKGNVCL